MTPRADTRTKIVATLGPASESPEVLDDLLLAGVDVVRLNLSHGTLQSHIERLQAVRAAAERTGQVVAVLADLPGPKVRSGQFADGGGVLVGGARLVLTPAEGPSTIERITVDYPTLLVDLQPGDRVVLGDGAISLRAEAVDEREVHCVVLTGGMVQGRPGVHLPSERLRLTTPTADDLVLGKAMAEAGADFLAVSFVRAAHDLRVVREAILPYTTRLVAKIETMPAVVALEAIAAEADAVMVARGDLGIECPLEDVPHLQKRIIRHCVEVGVPVITATQMMESMITAPSPTRAEVSDIANAVFDGTDALMLSAETAVGSDPAGVVRTMSRIAGRAEAEASYSQWASRLGRTQREQWPEGPARITMAITHAAGMAAADSGAQAILCCTTTGRTARAMARFRPSPTLISLSPDPATVRAMALSWGVRSLAVSTYHSTDDLVWFAVERGAERPHRARANGAGAGRRPRPAEWCQYRRAAHRARLVTHTGPAIWAEEAGDAAHPLVVLVHGAMDRSAGMLRLSRRLDHEYRVVRYDRRGYGRSTPHGGPFDMAAQVADLVQVLAGRRAVIVGHSYGGNVALAAAQLHPHLVAGVAIYETPLSWEPWWPGTTAGASAIKAAGRPHEAAEAFMRRLLGDARWDGLPERTRASRRAEGVALVDELADLREHRPWHADRIHVPVVVGYGTTGATHHRQGMTLAAETIRNAQLVVLDGCGHGAPNTNAEAFRRHLIDPLFATVGAPWRR